jgi:hypothetical protein
MRSSSGAVGNGRGRASTMPASSREISRIELNRPPSASTEPLICPTSRRPSLLIGWPASASTNISIACTGWRRSWLAAARKRDFATLAASATSFCCRRLLASDRFSNCSASDSTRMRLKVRASIAMMTIHNRLRTA